MPDPITVVLTATAMEQKRFADAFPSLSGDVRFGRSRLVGTVEGRRLLFAETGIGAVNTAHALTSILESTDAGFIIQTGIAGAYPGSDLAMGDIALATEEIYGDIGVASPGGWQPADAIGFPLVGGEVPRFNRFPLDPKEVEAASSRLSAASLSHRTGAFVTLQQVTGTDVLAAELTNRFRALCENMEGAAAAHVAALYDVPFLELRGISNRVGTRDPSAWNIPAALDAATAAVLHLIRD